jgi:iron complex transport system substrate-binding protein
MGGEGDGAAPDAHPRVASLLPSATEIVCALGLRDALVLRSHECDHPPGIEALPFATEPRYAPPGSSAGIDLKLRELLEEGLGVFRVDADRLRAAAPEVILTQDQCHVCAVPREAIEKAACALLDPPPRIVSLSPATLEEVLESVETVADALGVPERGRRLRGELEGRMRTVADGVRRRNGDPSAEGRGRPGVLTIEWFDPLMPAGNWVPELVKLAGGENLVGEAGAHSPVMPWEALARTDPDVIILLPCGFGIERAVEEVAVLEALPGWGELRAVRGGRVAVADGNRFFNRPGPRLVESAEILAEILSAVVEEEGARGAARHRWAGDGWRWVGDGVRRTVEARGRARSGEEREH